MEGLLQIAEDNQLASASPTDGEVNLITTDTQTFLTATLSSSFVCDFPLELATPTPTPAPAPALPVVPGVVRPNDERLTYTR